MSSQLAYGLFLLVLFKATLPIPVTLPVDDQIEMLYQFAYLAECNNAMSRMYEDNPELNRGQLDP